MFNKKSCHRCKKKINTSFEYCPHCGFYLEDKEKEREDYGLLGKNDINNFANELKLPLGFNTIFKKLMSEMNKQFSELDNGFGNERKVNRIDEKKPIIKNGGISINISSGAGTPIIKVRSFGNMPEFKEMHKQIKGENKKEITKSKVFSRIDEEKIRELSKLPRQEAVSKVRRLSGKVVYEIDLPEVKSDEDIIINQLENSIEIKAFAKDKAYFKFLPVSLPLLKYKLDEGKLILELGEE